MGNEASAESSTSGAIGGFESDVTLLLPGMTLNSSIFKGLRDSAISPEFCDLVLGSDGGPPELLRDRMGVYVRLLDLYLRQREREWAARRRIIVGHSFGGMLALAWLLEQPPEAVHSIGGLLLIATTAGPMLAKSRLRPIHAWPWRIPIAPLMRFWNRPLVTRTVKRLLTRGHLDVRRVDFEAEDISSDLALDMAGWRNTGWQAMRSFRLAMDGFDVRARLHEIDVATIVLHGTRDALFELDVARELADGLPRAELRIVEGAGHALPLTHSAEVQRAAADLRAGRITPTETA